MSHRRSNTEHKLRIPLWCIILLSVALVALAVYVIAAISPRFADAYTRTVGAFVRAALAHLTSWLPFSLAEILLYLLFPFVVFLGIFAYRRYCDTWRHVWLFLAKMLCAFSMLFSVFALGFGTGYHTHTLDQRLGLPEREVDLQALQATAEILVGELNGMAEEIEYSEQGFSVMPYDLDEMNDKLLLAYGPVCDRYPFIQRLQSRIKPVIASRAMSYTHITGVYTYFTGEANLNVHFPDYTLPFTAAHELAHQRGIARENEANFVAFLVCADSEDPYIRYSAYLNMYEYVANAIYRTDREAYRTLLKSLDPRIIGELRAYSAFFDEFRDSVASDVSGAVNDTYLKLNGNEAGSASYGLVVELAVAYFLA